MSTTDDIEPTDAVPPEFTFLVSTDNHMGYKENDHILRRDSFMAFKEALQIAREKDVDFILLGGDLFHVNKPSPSVEHKCIKILRQHMNAVVNKKTTSFRRIDGQFAHFEQVKWGNFEDPSLTVPYPILTIHGNHDDPTGPSGKSVVEKLATSGLLNYFGKFKPRLSNDNAIDVVPIVLQKDSIKLALYGLGFIPDKKLHGSFEDGLVTFKEPPQDTFNILIVHQNRRLWDEKRRTIPDSFFPKWFHLIIRGHEHDAMAPEVILESHVNGFVYQPGSTVATSNEKRESGPKQVAIMRISLNDPDGDQRTRYNLGYKIIDLKCYRKMIFKDIYQKEIFEHIKATDKRRKLTTAEYKAIFRQYVVTCIDKELELAEAARIESLKSIAGVSNGGGDSSSSQTPGHESGGSQSTSSVYNKLDRFRLPLARVRCEIKQPVECFDDLEVNALFYPTQVATRDIIKFKKQLINLAPDGTKTNMTFDDSNPDYNSAEEYEYGSGDIDTIDILETTKSTIDNLILEYFNDKKPDQRLKAISLEEYTDAVRLCTGDEMGNNLISKELAKKKMAILFGYKSELKSEQIAANHFNNQAKVREWIRSAFKGEKPLLPPGQEGESAEAPAVQEVEDDGDDIVVWDDEFNG